MQNPIQLETESRPVVGVSACLLGQEVRFNGGHSRNRYVTDVLGEFCSWVPVCPEVGMGMSTPRETLRLEGDPRNPRLMGKKSRIDYTDQFKAYAGPAIEHLKTLNLHGFILKNKSPSCGMARLPVYDHQSAVPTGVGLFAVALRMAFPLLPMEEDGRLFDADLRESFLRKLYAYKRLCDFRKEEVTPAGLVAFHTAHKLLLAGHHQVMTRQLGRLVAQSGTRELGPLLDEYGQLFMKCLENLCGRKRQAHTLRRVVGRLGLNRGDLREIHQTIDSYKSRLLPIAAPLTLLSHHLRNTPQIAGGIPFSLNPYPAAAAGPFD